MRPSRQVLNMITAIPDVLLHRLTVVNGMITTPEGITYKVLWLPKTTHMLPQTLEKINQLVRQGATIVGDAPKEIGTLSGGKNAQIRLMRRLKILGAASQPLANMLLGKAR